MDRVRMEQLRDRIRAVLNENLPDEELARIWNHVRADWLSCYPQSQWVLDEIGKRPVRLALRAVEQTTTQYLEGQEKAQEYREETRQLREAMAQLSAQWGKYEKK